MSRDRPNLLAMLDAIARISEYTRGIASPETFSAESIVFDATLMNFVVIGEMADRLSRDLKARHDEVDWQKIKDFRNIVAHDYMGVDAEEVWQILTGDLSVLEMQLREMVASLPD